MYKIGKGVSSMLKTTLKAVITEGVIVILAIVLLTSNFSVLPVSNTVALPIAVNARMCIESTPYQKMFADLLWILRYTRVCKIDV